jgi:TRAP-type C4-dicarboxylate transport system permease small subunit
MIERASRVGALLGGIATVAIAGMITLDVLMRYFLGQPLLFVDELASFLQVLIVFGGLAYTFRSGGHVRVDLVTSHLSPSLRAWLRVATLALGVLLIATIIWTTAQSAATAYRLERVSAVMLYPIWLPMLLIPAGLLLMALAMLGTLRRQLRAALGPREAREEVS